jgi:hypothetical protein
MSGARHRRKGDRLCGFVTLKKWLGEYDALFLRKNKAEPLVLRVWALLLERVRR